MLQPSGRIPGDPGIGIGLTCMGPTGVPVVRESIPQRDTQVRPAASHRSNAASVSQPALRKVSSLPKRQAKRTALSFLWALGSGSSWRVCGTWRKALSRRPSPSARRSGTISRAGRSAGAALRVHQSLVQRPLGRIRDIARRTGLSAPTVAAALGLLGELGIVGEITGRRRSRVFSHQRYLAVLLESTEKRPARVSGTGGHGCLPVGTTCAASPGERLDWEQRAGWPKQLLSLRRGTCSRPGTGHTGREKARRLAAFPGAPGPVSGLRARSSAGTQESAVSRHARIPRPAETLCREASL